MAVNPFLLERSDDYQFTQTKIAPGVYRSTLYVVGRSGFTKLDRVDVIVGRFSLPIWNRSSRR